MKVLVLLYRTFHHVMISDVFYTDFFDLTIVSNCVKLHRSSPMSFLTVILKFRGPKNRIFDYRGCPFCHFSNFESFCISSWHLYTNYVSIHIILDFYYPTKFKILSNWFHVISLFHSGCIPNITLKRIFFNQ